MNAAGRFNRHIHFAKVLSKSANVEISKHPYGYCLFSVGLVRVSRYPGVIMAVINTAEAKYKHSHPSQGSCIEGVPSHISVN